MAQSSLPPTISVERPETGKALIQGILDAVERVGNKVPHPAMIFVILIGIVIVLSHLFYMMGLQVTYQVVNPETDQVETATTAARSLLTTDGIRFMFTGVVQNFMNFNAVGVIIVAMVGVGVAEARRADELDRRGRHFHPHRAQDLTEHRYAAEPVDDAAEFRRLDQRRDHLGCNRAQPRCERRADAPRCRGVSFFSFTPFGIPVLILGIAYMLFAKSWLSVRNRPQLAGATRPCLRDWVDQYRLAGREHRVRITAGSVLVGKRIDELPLRSTDLNLIAIERSRRFGTGMIPPAAGIELQAGDVLFIDLLAPDVEVAALREKYAVDELPHASSGRILDRHPPGAVRCKDFIVVNLPAEFDEVIPAASKAPQALGVLGFVVALIVSGRVPNVQAALIGCLLMGLLGCVDMNAAYRSINWKSLVLIVGVLPFAIALERTGGVEIAANTLIALVGNASPRLVLGSLFLITALIGLFISNTATAVLMAPVALAIAHDLGVSPYPFAMVVALAASTAFMTPISSPVNTLVVGPGGYAFADFVRIGVPFAVMVLAVSVFLVPLLLPL